MFMHCMTCEVVNTTQITTKRVTVSNKLKKNDYKAIASP